jgi:hypothetical protein
VYIERHCLSTNERNNSVEDIAEWWNMPICLRSGFVVINFVR